MSCDFVSGGEAYRALVMLEVKDYLSTLNKDSLEAFVVWFQQASWDRRCKVDDDCKRYGGVRS